MKIASFEPDDNDDNAGGEFLIKIRLESNGEASDEQLITLRYPSRKKATEQFEAFVLALRCGNIVKKPQ